MSEPVVTGSDGLPETTSELSLALVFAVILRRRRTIIVATAIGMAIGLTFALLKKKSFTSSFSFVTEATATSNVGGLANLAGQFGVSLGSANLGGAGSPQLYADLLATRQVLGVVAHDSVTTQDGHRVSVPQLLKLPPSDTAALYERAVRTLRSAVVTTSVAARTTGAVSVSVRTGDPRASLEIANELLRALNDYNRQTRQSRAAEERKFAEGRLEEVRRAQLAAEDALHEFLQGNRQFSNASQLRFEQERLQGNLDLQRDLVRELSRQVEEARIREVHDTPIITLIEKPNLPIERDPLGRISTLAFYTMLGFVFGLMGVIARAAWDEHLRRDAARGPYSMLSSELSRVRLNPFRRG